MQYGYFDDLHKEYVITTPKTPLPWINYLGCGEFFSLISNTCGGYTFCRDARLLRLTRYRYNDIPADTNGKYIYIKDGDTIWNPGWQPAKTELDSYECRHGLGYSRFTSSLKEIEASVLAFIPLDDTCEIQKLTLTNRSESPRQLSLFSYVEWCLWDANDDMLNFQRNLSTGEVEIENGVIYHKTEYRERRNHYAFHAVNAKTSGYDTSRDAFIGAYRSNERPLVVEKGHCTNSKASGWSPVAVHQVDLTLAPGESRSLIYLLGFAENPPEDKWEAPGIINKAPAHRLLEKYRTDAAVEEAFIALKEYWNTLLSHYNVQSSNEKTDRMVNIWNQYQCMVTFNMSRSASYFESGIGRGMGFRDSCQDLLGFVHLIPDRARQRILDIAATQFADGSAYHQYQPLTKKGNSAIGSGFNDDPLWLIACTSAYIRETGDFTILDEQVPFDTAAGTEVPLMEHLRRSFDYTVTHKGPHGLPLIGRADWNDCLNLNCFSDTPGESFQTTGPSEGPVAESVFIAGIFVKYGGEYADLCAHHANPDEADRARHEVQLVYDAVVTHGWDGDWFLRAYDAHGDKVGSASCEEGQIYIEPQGFCTLAGIGVSEGLADKAMESVKKRLDTRYGIKLLNPPYTRYHLELGEITSYPPGYKENAGHGDRAFEIYKKTCPAYVEEISEIHRTEPYVYSQMVAGDDAPHFGEAKNSWLTGTAAWTFVDISQYILGIQPTLDGLKVDPCIPEGFGDYTVTRLYRGTTYTIHIHTRDGVQKGVQRTVLNGQKIAENVIPPQTADCTVDVYM